MSCSDWPFAVPPDFIFGSGFIALGLYVYSTRSAATGCFIMLVGAVVFAFKFGA